MMIFNTNKAISCCCYILFLSNNLTGTAATTTRGGKGSVRGLETSPPCRNLRPTIDESATAVISDYRLIDYFTNLRSTRLLYVNQGNDPNDAADDEPGAILHGDPSCSLNAWILTRVDCPDTPYTSTPGIFCYVFQNAETKARLAVDEFESGDDWRDGVHLTPDIDDTSNAVRPVVQNEIWIWQSFSDRPCPNLPETQICSPITITNAAYGRRLFARIGADGVQEFGASDPANPFLFSDQYWNPSSYPALKSTVYGT